MAQIGVVFRKESIRELRLEQGLTLVQFVKKAGIKVAPQSCNSWELGHSEPRVGILTRLATAYNKPIEYFFSSVVSSNDSN